MCFEHPGLLAPTPRPATRARRASPAPTRAAWARSCRRRRGEPRADGAHGRGARDGRHHHRRPRPPRRPRARARRHRHRAAARTPAAMADGDRLPLPVHRGRRARRRPAPGRPGRSAVGQGRRQRRLRAATLERTEAELAAAADARGRAFAAAGRLFTFGNGGSSTDAASLAALFARPPWGRALPGPLPRRRHRRRSPRSGNDVGFDLVFSRQLIAHAAAGDIARRPSRPAAARATCSPPSREARARGLAHHRLGRLRRWRDGRVGATCSTASSCGPTASTGSRRRRPRSASRCGPRCSAAIVGDQRWVTASDREATGSSTASRPSGGGGRG